MQDITPLPAVGFVRLSSLLPIIAISRAKVWRDVRNGKFQAPIRLSEDVNVRQWIADPQGWGKGAAK